jgi:hypothetical protein
MIEEEIILTKFFEAKNRREWTEYMKYLSEEGEWTFFTSKGRRIVKGKKNYIETMKKIYEYNKSRFTVISITSNDKEMVMAELEMEGRRALDVFEFRNGLIYSEREYYDDNY